MLPKTPYHIVDYDFESRYSSRSGERQVKPYDLMCSMTNFTAWIESRGYTHHYRPDCRPVIVGFDARAGNANIVTQSLNKSYERLVGQLGDGASLGATLTAERRETYNMVVGGLVKMLTAARHVRKFEFAKAARELGIPYHERTVRKRYRVKVRKGRYKTIYVRRQEFSLPNGRYATKSLASGWLLWSYGIKPLMGDIQAAGEALTSPFPWHRVSGSCTLRSKQPIRDTYSTSTYSTRVSTRQSVEVRVDNPNLWLANRLGLVNPAQMLNEAIPFSFVVDWCSNWSSVIMSMTDFVGLQQRQPCVNQFISRTLTYEAYYNANDWAGWDKVQNTKSRKLTLVTPTLLFQYERFEWQRALNAISLLVGFLPRK